MQPIKIVADSAADLTALEGVDFAFASLKIVTAEREFIDNEALNVQEMTDFLYHYKGRSSTACPNVDDWLSAFGDAERIICITITGGLSGSYNAACTAKQLYEDRYPSRRVHVIDSLSAGPEITLHVERMREMILEGLDFDEIIASLPIYKTELLFLLESLRNFANNGRVSKTAAAAAGVFGIRALGRASDEGTLELLAKPRGAEKSLDAILTQMEKHGCRGGRVLIAHCFAADTAERLAEKIRAAYPTATVRIHPCRGLCSFYAEQGGLLIGYEV